MAAGTYRATPMHPDFIGEDVPGNKVWSGSTVKYLGEEERAELKLSIRGGEIFDAKGDLFDTTGSRALESNTRRAIFVMDEHGNFFASKLHFVGRFHHSSLLAGAAVAAAGEIEVRNGELIAISDRSGHYLPGREFTDQAIQELEKCGIDTGRIEQDLIATS
jgi:hypothetical protein